MSMAIDTSKVAASLMTLAPDSVEAAAAAGNGSQVLLVAVASMAQKHFRGASVVAVVHAPSPVLFAVLKVSPASDFGPHPYVVLFTLSPTGKWQCKYDELL